MSASENYFARFNTTSAVPLQPASHR